MPVYGRYFRAGEFGVLSLLTITLTLFSIVLKFGLNQAFFRHYYETDDDGVRRRIVGSTLLFLLASALPLTALLYALAPGLSALILTGNAASPANAGLLRLVFYICFFEVITLVPDSILRVKFKSAQYSTLNIVAFAVQVTVICYLVMAVDASVQSVLQGRLIGAAFETVLFFWMVRRELSLRFSFAEVKGMLAFGAPLIFSQVAFQLFMMIDRFFLLHYATRRELGAYAMANTLVSAIGILVTVPFGQVWTVMRFSVMNEKGAEEYYSRVLTYVVFVSMFLSLCVSAVAGDGLRLFATSGYWPAATIIPLLAMSAVFDGASRVLNIGITLRKRTIYAPIVIVIALAVNIGLNFWLIPRYGGMGATLSTLASYVVFCALRYGASNLFFKVRYEWGRIFTLFLVGGLLMSCFYVNDLLRGPSPGRTTLYLSILTKTGLALLFPAVLFAVQFYDERERRRMAETWEKFQGLIKRERMPKPADIEI